MKACICALLLVTAMPALADQPAPVAATEVVDAAAAKKLLGSHGLTLQWIEQKQKGTVTVSNLDGSYEVSGEQRDAKGNFVTLEGRITKIERLDFTFEGKIVTRVDYLAKGEPCPRQGTFRFHIKGARKFWRLQEMQNTCEGGNTVDYVDVHFTAK